MFGYLKVKFGAHCCRSSGTTPVRWFFSHSCFQRGLAQLPPEPSACITGPVDGHSGHQQCVIGYPRIRCPAFRWSQQYQASHWCTLEVGVRDVARADGNFLARGLTLCSFKALDVTRRAAAPDSVVILQISAIHQPRLVGRRYLFYETNTQMPIE